MSVSPKWQPKLEMTWHLLSIPTGHRKPSRTEKQLKLLLLLDFCDVGIFAGSGSSNDVLFLTEC